MTELTGWLGPISYVVKKTGSLLPWLAGMYYTEERLAKLCLLDVSGSGTGLTYYYPSQQGTCWLQFINLSPFDFKIDRLKVMASVDGGSFDCEINLPVNVPGSSLQKIYINSKSPVPESASHLVKAAKKANLEIEAHIICKVCSFNLRRHIGDLRNVEIN